MIMDMETRINRRRHLWWEHRLELACNSPRNSFSDNWIKGILEHILDILYVRYANEEWILTYSRSIFQLLSKRLTYANKFLGRSFSEPSRKEKIRDRFIGRDIAELRNRAQDWYLVLHQFK